MENDPTVPGLLTQPATLTQDESPPRRRALRPAWLALIALALLAALLYLL